MGWHRRRRGRVTASCDHCRTVPGRVAGEGPPPAYASLDQARRVLAVVYGWHTDELVLCPDCLCLWCALQPGGHPWHASVTVAGTAMYTCGRCGASRQPPGGHIEQGVPLTATEGAVLAALELDLARGDRS